MNMMYNTIYLIYQCLKIVSHLDGGQVLSTFSNGGWGFYWFSYHIQSLHCDRTSNKVMSHAIYLAMVYLTCHLQCPNPVN